ncbi:MAG TPA: TetR/AcrR family transcriptional regulator [Jatrophihabitans sp.]|jgi:AcrR family transcriptional regulator|nr:TetR/AcrR family transcriptional regulator [Jatrophihabitans sp.]
MVTKRVRLSPEARRKQLIELGVEMLATRRLDELSVELIATTAGISRGLLFHYFSSKQEFHTEVARAAAAEMIRRTAPDPALAPVEALRGALTSFIDYVEENPDNYKSLVRGAASGDAEMRAIFDQTRATLARRIIGVVADLGLEVSPRVELAIHGWVAYVEECVIRWIDARAFDRDQLLEMLTKSLPAVALSATDEEVATLVAILTAERAIGAK